MKTSKAEERKGKLKRDMRPSFCKLRIEITGVNKEVDKKKRKSASPGQGRGFRTARKRVEVIIEEQIIILR